MSATASALISFGSRVGRWATEHPAKTAIVFVPEQGPHRELSWQMVESRSNQLAHLLSRHGVGEEGRVVIGLKNYPEHLLLGLATWKLGAMAIPVRYDTPARERNDILALAEPTVVISDWADLPYPSLSLADLDQARDLPTDPWPDIIAQPNKAMTSGGSTGRPKLIVDPTPWGRQDDDPRFQLINLTFGGIQLVCGPFITHIRIILPIRASFKPRR